MQYSVCKFEVSPIDNFKIPININICSIKLLSYNTIENTCSEFKKLFELKYKQIKLKQVIKKNTKYIMMFSFIDEEDEKKCRNFIDKNNCIHSQYTMYTVVDNEEECNKIQSIKEFTIKNALIIL